MDGLVEWHHGPAGIVQLIRDAERAGGSVITMVTADASAALDAAAQRGVDFGPLDDTTSDKVLFAMVSDPDGNAVTIVQRR